MSKFVMLDSHTLEGTDFSPELKIMNKNGIECILAKCKSGEEIIQSAKGAEAIGLNYSHITKEIINELENCKVIIRYGIGVDTIDIEAATEKGIAVCNLPDYCVDEVAIHAMALMLDICRKTTFFDRHVRTGAWDSNFGYKVHRLNTLTLGVIGFGNTGQLFSQYAKSFGMNIIVHDPFVKDSLFEQYGVQNESLDNLYEKADVISLHVPLTKETTHLIRKESIKKMKDGVIIINTSRGSIICLDDLLEALETDKVKAAGLDVIEIEPITDSNSKVYQYDNLVITPHSAYNSVESSQNQHIMVAETVIKILKGELPSNVLNKSQLENR